MLSQLRNAGKAKGRPQHHCTPTWLVALERLSIGGRRFDLDPASNSRSVVGAVLELTKSDDGLRYEWRHGPPREELARARGRWREHPGDLRYVHVNPPWETMDVWLPRIATEAARGLVVRAVVPLRPHRAYWQWPEAICYVPPVAFEGEEHGFPGPVAVLAWGMIDDFVATFGARFPTNTHVLQPGVIGPGLGTLAISVAALHNRVTMARRSNGNSGEPKMAPYEINSLVREFEQMRGALHAFARLVANDGADDDDGYDDRPPSERSHRIQILLAGLGDYVRQDAEWTSLADVRGGIERALTCRLPGKYPSQEERVKARELAARVTDWVFGTNGLRLKDVAPDVVAAIQKRRKAEQDKRQAEARARETAKKRNAKQKAAKKPAAKKPTGKPTSPAKKAAKKPTAKAAKPAAAGGRGDADVDERVRAILVKAKLDAPNGAGPGTEVRLEAIAELLGVSRATALRSLKRLKAKRVAHMVRGGRSAAWVLSSQPERPRGADKSEPIRGGGRAALPPAKEADDDDEDDDEDDEDEHANANGRDEHAEA